MSDESSANTADASGGESLQNEGATFKFTLGTSPQVKARAQELVH